MPDTPRPQGSLGSHVPSLLAQLAPHLSQRLQGDQEAILLNLIQRNANSIYFKESSGLNAFREFVGKVDLDNGNSTPSAVRLGFQYNVPLSTYENYVPFAERFFEKPCDQSRVVDLFAPGLPLFIALSSATSRCGKSKAFAKYDRPPGISSESNIIPRPTQGSVCRIFSLETYEVVQVEGDKTEGCRLPVTCLSAGRFSGLHGLNQANPRSFKELKVPQYSSPFAIGLIPHYRSFLLMHALFALVDPKVEIIYPIFSTTFFDFARFVDDQWSKLVQAIEDGVIPDYEGLTDDVKSALQAHFTANPSRAAALRAVYRSDAGWMKEVWPMLTTVVVIASGIFASLIPKMQHFVGPHVTLRGVGLTATESIVALAHDGDLNLFKINTEDFYEYMDPIQESPDNLKFAWEVQVGCQYEIVMTTRDGLWRYQLGDIVEVVGFDPTDGLPIIRYCGRKNAAMRIEGELVSEQDLKRAVASAELSLGSVSEFCVVVDDRSTPSAYGFLVELAGEFETNAITAKTDILRKLCTANECFKMDFASGRISPPTIRILKPRTFAEFRQWRIQTGTVGAAQVKVPVVVSDDQVKNWLLSRVEMEL